MSKTVMSPFFLLGRITLLGCISLTFIYILLNLVFTPQTLERKENLAYAIIPKTVVLKGLDPHRPVDHQRILKAFDEHHRFLGYAIHVTTTGSNGPIELIIGFVKNKITDVRIVSHYEPPGLGSRLADSRHLPGWNFSFLEQFHGKHIYDTFEIGKDIIPVNGAYAASKGICNGVRKAIVVYRKMENILY